jgi:hypothetical protein
MWPMLMTLWLALSDRPARRAPQCRRPDWRRRLEPLDERCLPSTLDAFRAGVPMR